MFIVTFCNFPFFLEKSKVVTVDLSREKTRMAYHNSVRYEKERERRKS